jgi:hypothetical protein
MPVLSSNPERSQVPLRWPLQMKYEVVGEAGCSESGASRTQRA